MYNSKTSNKKSTKRTVTIIVIFLLGILTVVSSAQLFAAPGDNIVNIGETDVWFSSETRAPATTGIMLDWAGQLTYGNSDTSGTIPWSDTFTVTNIAGSGVTATVYFDATDARDIDTTTTEAEFDWIEPYFNTDEVLRYWPTGNDRRETHIAFSEDIELTRTAIWGRYDSSTRRYGAILEAYSGANPDGTCTGTKLTPANLTSPIRGTDDHQTHTNPALYPVALTNSLTSIDSSDTGEQDGTFGTFSDPIGSTSDTLDTYGYFVLGTGNNGNLRSPAILEYGDITVRCLLWHNFGYENGTAIGEGEVRTDLQTSGYLGPIIFNTIAPPKVNLGNFVWYDADNNGVVNGNEAGYGIDGVVVELYDVTNTLVATDTTVGGYYLFENLDDGDYTVRIPSGNFTAGQPLNGFTSSDFATTDPDDDTDSDDDGQGNGTAIDIDSLPISLTLGTEPMTTTVAGDTNLTVDFGFTAEQCFDPTDLGGDIFRDFDHNGVNNGSDPAFYDGNTIVYAYDNDNNVVGTAVVRPDGTYNFDDIFATNSHIRLEFTGLPDYLDVGYSGPDNGTATQIHKAGTCGADLGVFNSADYCETAPNMAVTCFVNGDQTAVMDTLVTTSYDVNNPAINHEAFANQTGSIWGVAYEPESETIFSAAFLKRHVGFRPAGMDAIYATDAITTTVYVELNDDLGISVGAEPTSRGLNGIDDPSHDAEAYALVGKRGLGDIDYDVNTDTLWIVNLFDGRLYGIANIDPATTPVVGDLLTDGNGTAGFEINTSPAIVCNNGQLRPFGIEIHDNKLYAGAVCSGETSGATVADLDGHVLVLDLSNTAAGFSSVLTFDLDYSRQKAVYGGSEPFNTWHAGDTYYSTNDTMEDGFPMPVLSDIEFDNDGSMILAIMDRYAHMIGPDNYYPDPTGDDTTLFGDPFTNGDTLRACYVGNSFVIEGGAGCANNNPRPTQEDGANSGAAQRGPSGGEYYVGDWGPQTAIFAPDHADEFAETTAGSLAMLPGSDRVVSSAMDPDSWLAGGVKWLDNTTGVSVGGRDLYGYTTGPFDPDTGTFGKAGGIGDLTLICEVAPLEIGNYIWQDDDADGVQDPCENGLDGVEVQLWSDPDGIPGNGDEFLVETTYTDAAGEYYFEVDPNSTYLVAVDPDQASLEDFSLTVQDYAGDTPHPDSGNSTDVHDSDGEFNPTLGLVIIDVATGDAGANDYTFDIGFAPDAALGNYVWLDEDSDGMQDAGEHGIPNVIVTLTPPAGIDLGNGIGVAITTTTDANGGYLFDNLPPVDGYVVTIDPAQDALGGDGLVYTVENNDGTDANDADLGNQDPSGYQIDLSPGEIDLSADFGYNHNPDSQVNGSTPNGGTGLAAIGDTIWIDSDGDGIEDPSEIGVSGVTVTLYHDPDGNGVYDTVYGTTTTDENGHYIFDDLPAGAYSVEVTDSSTASHDILATGYTQTGDPDHFGTTDVTPANNDNLGDPVVLAPGDVFLNMDFGYQPANDNLDLNSVGDTIWYDADSDGNGMSLPPVDGGAAVTQGAGGTADAVDYPIAGVTVALIDDLDGDGIWDAGEPIIASDVTDENGQYLFEDLADGNYIVWVNDTDGVLVGLSQTYDASGPLDNTSAVDLDSASTLSVPVDDRDQDFGYSDNSPLGTIGDTVWFDADNSGDDQTNQGAESGIGGVTVNLYIDDDNDGNADDINGDGIVDSNDIVATDVTDSNGNYLFENLPFNNYIVEVDDTTLPAGLTQTYDADGTGTAHTSATTIDETTPHDRDQDFSYTDSTVGSIGDTIWGDLDSSGGDQATQGSEPGLGGVTVSLTPPPTVDLGNGAGQPIVTTTDGDGNYLFDSLPLGNVYTVTVDTGTLPAGFSSAATYDADGDGSGGFDSTSAILIDGGNPHDRDQDFSYPPTGASYTIGDYVWFDVDSSGSNQAGSAGEPPLSSVELFLYDGSGNLIDSTTTDADGYYLFTGLLTDTYTIEVNTDTLPPYVSSISSYDGTDGTSGDSGSTVTVDASNPHGRGEDFSYPPGVDGMIGDTVWFDLNGDGVQESNEAGIPGVTVELTFPDGSVQTAVTDQNGNYLFDNLPVSDSGVTYTVTVITTTLPAGMQQTYDQDAPTTDHTSTTSLTTVTPIDLDQDFGYNGNNSLGNLVWLDTDADGSFEPTGATGNADDDEPLIAGVTLDIYMDSNGNGELDSGDTLVTSAVTTGTAGTVGADTGNYLVEGLPDGTFFVNVTDEDGVLNGYWHSDGVDNMTNESQNDAYYTVPLDPNSENSAGEQNLTADFGYYVEPAAVGNYIWVDTDADGLQDDGETGLNGVEVQLVIDYPDGTSITVTTVTTDDISGNPGWYSFDNLLYDEDYAQGSSTGSTSAAQPAYTIMVDTDQTALADYTPTTVDVGTNGSDLEDSDDHDGVIAIPLQGSTDVEAQDPETNEQTIASYDFGFTVPVRLGGLLWEDVNNDEQADTGDTHNTFANVEVHLYDANSMLVMTTTADATGEYLFEGLAPGEYTVHIPATVSNTAAFAGFTSATGADEVDGQVDPDNNNDNDDNGFVDSNPAFLFSSLPISVTSGIEPMSETDGIDNLTNDEAQANAADGTTAAYDDNDSNLTVDFGFFGEPVQIGNYIWYEADGDGDATNGSPMAASGLTVTVTASDGTTYTAVTDLMGLYTVTVPANATYTVTVATPDGYEPSTVLVSGADTTPGDNNNQNHDSSGAVVTVGTTDNFDIDFAFTPVDLYSIGNWVWLEDDMPDGVYSDTVESGINGVTVELWDGVPNAMGSTMISSTTTVNGAYSFDDLMAGTYYVHVPTENFTTTGALYDGAEGVPYDISSVAAGGDDVMVGTGDANSGVSSGPIVVGDGNEPTGEDLHGLTSNQADAQTEWNVDFGFFIPEATSVAMSSIDIAPQSVTLISMIVVGLLSVTAVVIYKRKGLI